MWRDVTTNKHRADGYEVQVKMDRCPSFRYRCIGGSMWNDGLPPENKDDLVSYNPNYVDWQDATTKEQCAAGFEVQIAVDYDWVYRHRHCGGEWVNGKPHIGVAGRGLENEST
jgi:hypothetical protein